MEVITDIVCVRLCGQSMKDGVGIKERSFLDALGLPYNGEKGSITFNDDNSKELCAEVTKTAHELRKHYESKNELRQAMTKDVFDKITQPLLEKFADKIWIKLNIMNIKNLIHTREGDRRL
jgi:hypothetical protein